MSDPIVTKAQIWGFPCQLTENGIWQIFPSQSDETWRLSQLENRWLLSIKKIPQIYLTHTETLRFLESRYRLKSKKNSLF